jgi:hypothetical protein
MNLWFCFLSFGNTRPLLFMVHKVDCNQSLFVLNHNSFKVFVHINFVPYQLYIDDAVCFDLATEEGIAFGINFPGHTLFSWPHEWVDGKLEDVHFFCLVFLSQNGEHVNLLAAQVLLNEGNNSVIF